MKLHRTLPATLAALAALTLASGAMAQTPSPANTVPVKNIVLVHGLYADGSSWEKVIPLLQAKGYHVTSVQNSDDVAGRGRRCGQARPGGPGRPHAARGALLRRHGHQPGRR